MTIMIVRMDIKPGSEEYFVSAFEHLGQKVRETEPGVLDYRLVRTREKKMRSS